MERFVLFFYYGICIIFCYYNFYINIDKVLIDNIVIMSDFVKFCFNESIVQLGVN